MQTFAQKQNQPKKPVSSRLARPDTAASKTHQAASPHLLLQLALGSLTVQRMPRTHAEELEAGLSGTASPHFGHDCTRPPIHLPAAGAIQTKLAINKPGDEYEQEADRVSEQVMHTPMTQQQRPCACGRGCPECRTEQPDHEDVSLQTKHVGTSEVGQSEIPSIVHEVVRSPGEALEPASRNFMESYFGHDFSAVRVHTGSEAAEAARVVQAKAFTVNPNIVFGHSEFAPGTTEGRRLMAHELAHVIQQRSNPMLAGRVVQRQRSALEGSTSQEERGKLRVLTLESVTKLSPNEIRGEFKTKEKGNIPADDIKFGPGIAEGIKQGLQNIAAEFFSDKSFTFNTVTNVPLNLKAVGGVDGVYRFTLVERKSNPKRQLIIEQVSATPSGDPSKIDVAKATKRFENFEFALGSGFGSEDDKKLLFAALARVPDSILKRVRGLKFEKKPESVGEKDEAGKYDPNTHTITLYASSLKKLMNSIDTSGSDWFTQTVAHEVGHALDYESFTTARVKRDALTKQLKDARLEARRVATPAGDEKAQAEKEKKDQQEIDRLEKALAQAESDSGKALNLDPMKGGGGRSQSTEFAKARGKAISTYGGKSDVENFAELSALFILDPDSLKLLRPDAYKYFSDTFK
ncbi:MAG TPA: DUF4157 domain-containing protein [Longimicrobium sp.]|jgi:hypothetical protein